MSHEALIQRLRERAEWTALFDTVRHSDVVLLRSAADAMEALERDLLHLRANMQNAVTYAHLCEQESRELRVKVNARAPAPNAVEAT